MKQTLKPGWPTCQRKIEVLDKTLLAFFVADIIGNRAAESVLCQPVFGDAKPGLEQVIGDMKFHFVAQHKNAIIGTVDVGAQKATVKLTIRHGQDKFPMVELLLMCLLRISYVMYRLQKSHTPQHHCHCVYSPVSVHGDCVR